MSLYAIGLGVTGAFLGTTASLVVVVRGAAGAAAAHAAHGAAATSPAARCGCATCSAGPGFPILGFTLIAALQNIDIVYVKREIGGDEAGSYAAASVAAKAVIWIAIGLGLYLLPEAVKRTRTGGDARPVLAKTLGPDRGGGGADDRCCTPSSASQIMAAVFGDDLTSAAGALPLLAVAMALLACAYLAVQYLIALERANFLPVLGLAAAAELVLLPIVGAVPTKVALLVVTLQLAMLPAFLGLVSAQRPTAPIV